MDRKIISLLGLMVVSEIDAETLLLHLLKDRLQELRAKQKRKNKAKNGGTTSAISPADSSEGSSSDDAGEEEGDEEEEEEMSSDCDITSDEDIGNPKIVPTEKVMIKSEPQDDFDISDADSDEDTFSEIYNAPVKVVIKEEPKDVDETTDNVVNGMVKIESEEMIVDDHLSNKSLISHEQDPFASGTSKESCEEQNVRLGSLVTQSLKSLKSKQSREKLQRLIKQAIKDVANEDIG